MEMTELGVLRLSGRGLVRAVCAVLACSMSLAVRAAPPQLRPSEWEWAPLFTVPRLTGPVRVDGVLADNEWGVATRVSAVSDAVATVQSAQPVTFWLAHHDGALLVAFRMQRPKGSEHPRITDTSSGYTAQKLFQQDDNLEVWLAPISEGVKATGMMSPQYAFAANAGGAYCHVMTGYPHDKIPRALEYSPHVDYNTGEWQGEVAVPWRIFEVMDVQGKRSPAEGVSWRGVLFFHQVTPAKNYLGLQPRLRMHPVLRFSGEPVGFSVSAVSLAEEGTASFQVAVLNQSNAATTHELDYEVFRRKSVPRGGDEQFITVWEQIRRIQEVGAKKAAIKQGEIQYVKTVEDVEGELNQDYVFVDGGKRALSAAVGSVATCPVSFAAPDGYYVLRYEIRDTQTGETVMRQVLPVQLFTMSLQLRPEFLLKQMIVACADLTGLDALSKGDGVRFVLSDGDGGVVVQQDHSWDGASRVVTALLPSVDTQEGKTYEVAAEVSHAGTRIGRVSRSVTRPPSPEWFGNRLGYVEKVPWGFEPIRYEPDGFSVVFRRYMLAGSIFPTQVFCRDEPLLAGAIELTGVADGDSLEFSASGLEAIEQTPTRVVLEQGFKAGKAEVSVRAVAEFDGFIRYDMTLCSVGDGASIDQLQLEIPVLPAYTTWYAHQALSTDLAGVPCPAYPYGALDQFFADNPDGWIPFTWAFYLGCRSRGVEWVAESDRDWVPGHERRMIRVTRSPGRTALVVQFIGKQLALTEPRTFSFGLQTTPVRDYPRSKYHSFYKTALSYSDSPDWDRFGSTLKDFSRMGFNTYGMYINAKALGLFSNARYYDETTLGAFTRYAKTVHQLKHRLTYYCGYGLPHGIPHDETFGEEMRMEPVKPSGWYNHASPFTDYFIHSVKFMCDTCDLDGIQTDGFSVVPLMTNPTYGFEWYRNGRRHGTYPVFAARDAMKRLYLMLKFELARGKEGFHTLHCDRPPVYCVDAWSDLCLSGEAHHHSTTSLRELFPDRYGVFYDTLAQGAAPYALWSYGRDIAVTRNMAYTLHHLHGISAGYSARLGSYGPAYEITGGFNTEAKMWHEFGLANAEFVPYWERPDLVAVESDHPDVTLPKDTFYCSAFIHRGEAALLIIANLDRIGYTLKLLPRLEEFGLPRDLSNCSVRDPVLGAGIFSRPKIRLDIHPQRWRALEIRKQP